MSRADAEKIMRLLTVVSDTRHWLLARLEEAPLPNAGFIVERLTMALEDHGWLPDSCEAVASQEANTLTS